MSARRLRTLALTLTTPMLLAAAPAATQAAAPPVRLAQTTQFPAEFEGAHGVAVSNDPASALYRDVYVLDLTHHRVSVFSPVGVFVEMFGKNVNAGAPGDLCKAGEKCQPGEQGPAAGQFSIPTSGVAIDPSTGEVWVAEEVSANEETGQRVQEFTAEGQFVLEIGREVNQTRDQEAGATTAQKNLCTAAEIAKGTACGPPKPTPPGSSEEGAFNFLTEPVIAAGGPEGLLFVGDEQRVQEFNAATGAFVRQIPLSPAENRVRALALDQASGELYLVYSSENVVQRFDEKSTGAPLGSFTTQPRIQGQEIFVMGLAVDPSGRIAVVEFETGPSGGLHGSLYDPLGGRRISGFPVPPSLGGLAFSDEGELDLADEGFSFSGDGEKVFAYAPLAIGEALAGGSGCVPGPEKEDSATVACTLEGEVSTEGVAETEAFFQLGRTAALREATPAQPVAASGPVQATVDLRPNQPYFFKLAGFDQNDKAPEEPFTSEQATLTTPTVAPHVFGSPSTISVGSGSAVLFAELNPENAHSEYFFEYAAGEHALSSCPGVRNTACPGVATTRLSSSAVYGRVGASAETGTLQAATTYHYRLFAENQSTANPTEHLQTISPEASFTTPAAPTVHATTGPASAVTTTAAMISGTVDSEGQPAGYTFELAVAGPEPQYGAIYAASTGTASTPIAVSQQVAGLQPATTYAYRITIRNGYGEATSEPQTFTTEGLPALLASPAAPALLPTPAVAFPTETTPSVKPRTVRNGLAAALRACAKQPAGHRRAACRRHAEKRYGRVRGRKR